MAHFDHVALWSPLQNFRLPFSSPLKMFFSLIIDVSSSSFFCSIKQIYDRCTRTFRRYVEISQWSELFSVDDSKFPNAFLVMLFAFCGVPLIQRTFPLAIVVFHCTFTLLHNWHLQKTSIFWKLRGEISRNLASAVIKVNLDLPLAACSLWWDTHAQKYVTVGPLCDRKKKAKNKSNNTRNWWLRTFGMFRNVLLFIVTISKFDFFCQGLFLFSCGHSCQ